MYKDSELGKEMFQILIGSLSTVKKIQDLGPMEVFQILIGSLSTFADIRIHAPLLHVSNPYR